MKIYESITRKELLQKYKPIRLTLPEWSIPASSINKIIKRQTTSTGKVNYIVQFNKGETVKVPSQVLNKTHKELVENYELSLFRSKEPAFKKRRTAKYQKRVRFNIDSDDDEDEDNMSNFIIHSSDEEIENIGSSTTRSGRQTLKRKSFEREFYPDGVKVKNKKSIYYIKVPHYQDKEFIELHSKYCFRCNDTGECNEIIDVPVGPTTRKCRLILCKTCSYSYHNNCLPQYRISSFFNKETGEFQCPKCSAKKHCSYCEKSLKNTNNEITFRCNQCNRGSHQNCVKRGASPDLKQEVDKMDLKDLYSNGLCIECRTFGTKPGNIVGEKLNDDNKRELLIKWKDKSFRHTNWVNESWFEKAQPTTHRAYLKKKSDPTFEITSEIPIEWKIVDRILNIEWSDKDKTTVKRILAVMKDSNYDDAVWDDPPEKEDTELYPDYKLVLDRYIQASKVKAPTGMKQLIKDVRNVATKEKYEKHEYKSQPDFITGGKLMKHQLEALNWLLYQWENKQSCILADDMGLGKTIQIISYLYVLFKRYNIFPFIIVVPNSTATNWIREFQKWAPEMTVAPYFGSQVGRSLAMQNEILDGRGNLRCHVVVATYESSMEVTRLHNVFWAVMVVDESQRLKNDQSLLFKTLKKYHIDHIILLTGTPLQNNLKELFNIMNFIQPKDFHGNEAEYYSDMTQTNIEHLHKRLRPHFLRRTKEEVLKSLPPKYELIVPLSMTPIQKEVYKDCLSKDIYETLCLATGSKVQRGLLSIFSNLRKVLNHPYLLDGVERAQKTAAETQIAMINACAKLKIFHQMFPKLKANRHRILIFSTMTRTLDLLEDYFAYEKIHYTRIDGSSNERARVRSIDAFNAPNSQLDVFLLSTRAGGVGINLATADTVVIWDSDFNPYADLQAISRAHRIGQNNMVLILRFMTRLTIEEKVLQIGKKKMALEHVVVERMKDTEEESFDDIENILKFGAEALFSDDGSKDITYDSASLDNLLDREKYREAAIKAQEEAIAAAEQDDAKATEQGLNFSFAKVWKSDGVVEDLASDEDNNKEESEDFWQKFLKEKEIEQERKKEQDRLAAESLGRGARNRAVVAYAESFRSSKEKDAPYLHNEIEDEAKDEDEIEDEAEDEDGAKKGKNKPTKPILLRINGPKPQVSNKQDSSPVPLLNQAQIREAYINNFQKQQQLYQQQQFQHFQMQQQQQYQRQQQCQHQNVLLLQPNQSQQQGMYPVMIHNYQNTLYGEMLQAAYPPITRLKTVATKAFNDNMQNSPAFHAATKHLYDELFKVLDTRFRTQFLTQFSHGQANNIEKNILDNIYQGQLLALKNNFERLTVYVNEVMQDHFKKMEKQWAEKKERERKKRAEEEFRAQQEATRIRYLQEEKERHAKLKQLQQKHDLQAQQQAQKQAEQVAFHNQLLQQQTQLRLQEQEKLRQYEERREQERRAEQERIAQRQQQFQTQVDQQMNQVRAEQEKQRLEEEQIKVEMERKKAEDAALFERYKQDEERQKMGRALQAQRVKQAQRAQAQSDQQLQASHTALLQAPQQLAQQAQQALQAEAQQLQQRQSSPSTQNNTHSTSFLPEVMTPAMIHDMANFFASRQGQNITQQDFLAQINQLALKEAEERKNLQEEANKKAEAEEKRLRDEAKRRQEEVTELNKQNYLTSKEKLFAAQRERELEALLQPSTPLVTNNNNNNRPIEQPYESSSQLSIEYADPDPEVVSRTNAAFFENISPEAQRTIFCAPPPLPDTTFLDEFEKASSCSPKPKSPTELSYPSSSQDNNNNYQQN